MISEYGGTPMSYFAPNAWAATSRNHRSFATAISHNSLKSATCPNRSTPIIPRVLGPISALTLSGSIRSVSGSMSAKRGMPPKNATHSAGAMNVKSGTMTSSPGLIPRAMSAMVRASVPLAHAMALVSGSARSFPATTPPFPAKEPCFPRPALSHPVSEFPELQKSASSLSRAATSGPPM